MCRSVHYLISPTISPKIFLMHVFALALKKWLVWKRTQCSKKIEKHLWWGQRKKVSKKRECSSSSSSASPSSSSSSSSSLQRKRSIKRVKERKRQRRAGLVRKGRKEVCSIHSLHFALLVTLGLIYTPAGVSASTSSTGWSTCTCT